MSTSGTTTGTSLGGVGGAASIYSQERLPYTLLAPARYAQIMGITPPHFWQASSPTIFRDSCKGVWYQHDWQTANQVSREQLCYALLAAEDEIATVLGYYPAPKWISKEMHDYSQHYRRELYGNGRDVRGQFKSLSTRWGRFIQAGRRAVTLVGNSTAVTYSDPDGDGYKERATITVVGITTTDACELKVYFEDKAGHPDWEIRPPKSKALSGGTLTVIFDSWLLINPDLQEVYPDTDNPIEPINLLTESNYVANVDVYREYTDSTVASAEFSWQPKPGSGLFSVTCPSCGGSGCAACENTTQDGCLHIRDVNLGIVVPTPATYDNAEAQWTGDTWTECREPDTVKFWYYAGELDEKYLQGTNCEPLSQWFAQAIAWLTTARLDRDVCGCSNVIDLVKDLRRDLAYSEPEGGSYLTSEEALNNPFGTKLGEVKAWMRIRHLAERVPDMAAI